MYIYTCIYVSVIHHRLNAETAAKNQMLVPFVDVALHLSLFFTCDQVLESCAILYIFHNNQQHISISIT